MKSDKRIWLWLLVWGFLDLLCASFCEIHADEAYYRLYGQFLDWGYFDHPPMVGLMTALSAILVPGTSLILKNLSVRLVTVLVHMATVWVVWKTVLLTEHRPATPDRLIYFVGSCLWHCRCLYSARMVLSLRLMFPYFFLQPFSIMPIVGMCRRSPG